MTEVLRRASTASPRTRTLGRADEFETAPWPTGIRRQEHAQVLLIGPIDGANTSEPACAHCIARRWQALRPENLREALEAGTGTTPVDEAGVVNPFAEVTVDAVEQFAQGVVDRAGSRYSQVFSVDRERLLVAAQPVVPDPECQTCSDLPTDVPGAADLSRTTKRAPLDFRQQSIFEYDLDQEALVGPVCGALGPRSVEDLTSTTTSATIGCFTTRSGSYLREVFWGGHEDRFDVSALVGVLEGLERVAGMRPRGRRTGVHASLTQLTQLTQPAVDPRVCGLYDQRFHRTFAWVLPFEPDHEIDWVWGHSLRDDRSVLVPEVLSYYHIPGQQHRFVQESSSGCATGGSVTEAALFGLLELIERDAFVIGWYAGRPLPEIDADTITSTESRAMIARLRMAGYEARFFDARVTFDVPVVMAVAERIDGGLGRLCFGAGASFDPEAAIASALCEIATDAPNSRMRTTNHLARLEAMVEDLDRVLSLHDHPLLYGLPQMRHHAAFLLDHPHGKYSVSELFEHRRPMPRPTTDLRADLQLLVDAVAAAGFDTVAVDQTMAVQRSLGLHTVSVITPGLVPVDFGWARQRARSMERTLTARHDAGLDQQPLAAADLTRAPHPLP